MSFSEVFSTSIPFLVPAFTAIAAGLAGYLTAGWRIREVRLAYEQKIRDSYLDNARSVSAKVYVPLAIALSALVRAYSEFRSHVDFDKGTAPVGAINRFKSACKSFEAVLQDLFQRGASAYLTIALEKEVSSFSSFLQRSLESNSFSKKFTLSPRFYGNSSSLNFSFHDMETGRRPWSYTIAKILSHIMPIIPMPGVYFSIEEENISSPIYSRDFEFRFQKDTLLINALIKEVTLGSRISPN